MFIIIIIIIIYFFIIIIIIIIICDPLNSVPGKPGRVRSAPQWLQWCTAPGNVEHSTSGPYFMKQTQLLVF